MESEVGVEAPASKQPPNGFDGVVFVGGHGRGSAAGGPHRRRIGCGRNGGDQREADEKQFGFRPKPLKKADSWKTFAWIRLSSALLRCPRTLAECPAAWTVFRGCLCSRRGERRRGEFHPIRRQAMDFEEEAGSTELSMAPNAGSRLAGVEHGMRTGGPVAPSPAARKRR